mmetsp:Transcript_33186/g.71532  ORF Transcript_33186/g.71532 Transcript_33186/m.71532 type:complete len:92 (+) Transcript_33186:1127-1402(+)
MSGAKGPLGLLHFPAQLLNGALVLGHVLTMLLLEDLHEVLHHALIEIFSSQVCVAISGQNLKNTVVDGQQGDIKGATTQVIDQDVLIRLLI